MPMVCRKKNVARKNEIRIVDTNRTALHWTAWKGRDVRLRRNCYPPKAESEARKGREEDVDFSEIDKNG